MSKHTPGPWQIGKVNHKKQRIDLDSPATDPRLGYSRWDGFARVYGCEYRPDIGSEIMMANAQLIAAAPELLDALRGLVYHVGTTAIYQDVPEINAARKAIRKATGEE